GRAGGAGAPRRLVRTCVASRVNSRSFGPPVAAAHSRDFFAARRRALVADGCAYNRSIHRGYFADFVPIVDPLHVVGYRFPAAHAVAVAAGGPPPRPRPPRLLAAPGPAAGRAARAGRP